MNLNLSAAQDRKVESKVLCWFVYIHAHVCSLYCKWWFICVSQIRLLLARPSILQGFVDLIYQQ